MWQRLQTLYMAIGLGLIVSLFFCNFLSYDDMTMGGNPIREVLTYRAMRHGLYLALLIITLFLQVVCILSFKSRMVQMWLVIFNALLLIGLNAIMIYDIVVFSHQVAAEAITWYHISYVTSVFPVIVSILNFLAAKNIMLDEAMVQSASRIRSARRDRKR